MDDLDRCAAAARTNRELAACVAASEVRDPRLLAGVKLCEQIREFYRMQERMPPQRFSVRANGEQLVTCEESP